MREALIVATARTPIGRAYRGAFNYTPPTTLAAHAIAAGVDRARLDPAEIDDVILGCIFPQGYQQSIGRTAALRAGLPVTVPGMTMDRQCSSGLMSISTAAKQIIVDRMEVVVAGGVESISLVQTPELRITEDVELIAMHDDAYMPMLDTAETVAVRYGISRERQDRYALQSQERTAAAQAAGAFDDEIVALTTTMRFADKASGAVTERAVTLAKDEGNRPGTDIQALSSLTAVREGGSITAGNASQLSDGASACVVMEAKLAEKRGLEPLGRYVGMAVVGTKPDEMGIGPVFAVPKLLKHAGRKLQDVDVVELNEAFASQVVYCRDRLGIDPDKLNPNGGSISIGHPYGMTGSRCTGTILNELRRSKKRYGIVTMCIGGGMGAAGLFEAA
jgi:acetyl-CoA C-acetyltransferase